MYCKLLAQSEADNSDTSSRRVHPAVHHLSLSLNVWRADVLYCISGFVVKKLLESIIALIVFQHYMTLQAHDFQKRKSLLNCRQYGHLMLPSDSVYRVVACVGTIVRRSFCKRSSFTKKGQLAISMPVLVFLHRRTLKEMMISLLPSRR